MPATVDQRHRTISQLGDQVGLAEGKGPVVAKANASLLKDPGLELVVGGPLRGALVCERHGACAWDRHADTC